jgi:hypothetical protein
MAGLVVWFSIEFNDRWPKFALNITPIFAQKLPSIEPYYHQLCFNISNCWHRLNYVAGNRRPNNQPDYCACGDANHLWHHAQWINGALQLVERLPAVGYANG